MKNTVNAGEMRAIRGAVARCYFCNNVETFTAEVKGGWHTHAKMYGWSKITIYDNPRWLCPICTDKQQWRNQSEQISDHV